MTKETIQAAISWLKGFFLPQPLRRGSIPMPLRIPPPPRPLPDKPRIPMPPPLRRVSSGPIRRPLIPDIPEVPPMPPPMQERFVISREVNLDSILCFIDNEHNAYFTTQSLDTQTGQGWHQKPYQYNAGQPDRASSGDWSIFTVAFDSDMQQQGIGSDESISVYEINSGLLPWLRSTEEIKANTDTSKMFAQICPGDTLRTFISIVLSTGGQVYLPVEAINSHHAPSPSRVAV